MKKMIANLVTLQEDSRIFIPWLINFKVFQSHGWDVFINAGNLVKKINLIADENNFKWLSPEEKKDAPESRIRTKISFMLHALRKNIFAIRRSTKIFKDNNFDLIYTPSSVLDFVIYPFYLKITRKKIKWATTLANIVPITDEGNRVIRLLAWFFFKISLQMMRKADIIFASTPEIKSYLLGKNFLNNKVILTGFAVENEMIRNAKKKEGMAHDALFVGRINETKGIYDMLKVLSILRKKYPRFQLAIMGDGDETTKKRFKEKIARMKLENNIKFLGYRSGLEKYDIIKSARTFWFLSTSQSESFGVALLEAVCSGVPAFAYDLPQFSWLYPNGEVNISPMSDHRLVAEKVTKLFESGNFRNEKGEKLLDKYSWESIAEKEYSAIEKLFT